MQPIRILPVLLLLVGCVDPERTTAARSAHTLAPVEQCDRFPAETEGEWVSASELRAGIVILKDERFEAMQPLPEEGYVPIQAIFPTVSVIIFNDSDRDVARVRVRVTAFASEDSCPLAAEVTDVPGWYWLIPPRSSKRQVLVLDDKGGFSQSAKWPAFTVRTELVDVQFTSAPTATASQPTAHSDNPAEN